MKLSLTTCSRGVTSLSYIKARRQISYLYIVCMAIAKGKKKGGKKKKKRERKGRNRTNKRT
jgi:hypothetical protein